MGEVRSIEVEQLRRIVDAFTSLRWPLPAPEMKHVAAGLDWEIELDRKRGIDFLTGYEIDTPRASVMYNDGNAGQISIDASDQFLEPDSEQTKALAATARVLRDRVVQVKGEPVRVRNGKNARYTWDLDNGGRVVVALLHRVVQVIVLQQKYADLERREEGLGISDDRDPSADLD